MYTKPPEHYDLSIMYSIINDDKKEKLLMTDQIWSVMLIRVQLPEIIR